MKKFLQIIMAIFVAFLSTTTVFAENDVLSNDDQTDIIDSELTAAIISGDGSEENPYIVDYSLAPTFKQFVESSYDNAGFSSAVNTRASGFTGYVLTAYKGTYSNGAVWTYSSGGLSVAVDGNLRITRIAYVPVTETHRLWASKNSASAWSVIKDAIELYSGKSYNEVVTSLAQKLIASGLNTIGVYSANQIAQSVAKAIGSLNNVVAVSSLIVSLSQYCSNLELQSASNNNLTFLNISYLTSYHGAWYQNYTTEAGWANNAVYIPSSTYGSGYFYSN